MNNTCPSCGALYNVASKDIGRRLKCKKCNAALQVTEAGLELDTGAGPLPSAGSPAPSDTRSDEDGREDREDRRRRRRERPDREPGPTTNPLELLAPIGGIPTILFGIGVFFVILFTALPLIGQAGHQRDKAYRATLELERDIKIKNAEPKKKKKDWTDEDNKKLKEDEEKITEDYARPIYDADMDAKRTENRNTRTAWYERYGLMFGFMFVAFGCIGYLRTEQPLVLKIVGGVILTAMMLIMFMIFGGCQVPRIG